MRDEVTPNVPGGGRDPMRAPAEGGLFDDPDLSGQMRAFLRNFAIYGMVGRACELAGIHPDTPYGPRWKNSQAFQTALESARVMAARRAEDAAFERGIQGVRRLKFNNRTGAVLLDPDECDGCHHDRRGHMTPNGPPDPSQTAVEANCTVVGCGCTRFAPGPYIEREFSDDLLGRVLGAHDPRYAERKRYEVSGALKRVDWSRMPAEIQMRVAGGEALELILGELVLAGMTIPLRPERELVVREGSVATQLPASRGPEEGAV